MTDQQQATALTAAELATIAAGRAALDDATVATAAALNTVPLHELLALLHRYEHELNTEAQPPYDAEGLMFATQDELASRPVETVADALVLFQWANHELQVHGRNESACLGKVTEFLKKQAATQAAQAAA